MKTLTTIGLPTAIAFAVAMSISLTRWPVPQMHDDFSNLLAADTLLHGRLANPTPSAYESMETFHVVMTPTYASKFPLGPAFFLMLGKSTFGYYACGLWLSCALATATTTWMLLACFPPRWASCFGLYVALHPFWQNGWSQEFTHGWLPFAGVSLVLGGTLRLHRILRLQSKIAETIDRNTWRAATVAIALGCGLVLFSRPFDGGIVCVLLLVSLAPQILRWISDTICNCSDVGTTILKATVPSLVILVIAFCLQLMINIQVTGNWFQLPYQLHEKQYGVAPLFIWGTPNEPSIGHRFIEQATFHRQWSMQDWQYARSLEGFASHLICRCSAILTHWGIGLAVLPFAILTWRRGRRQSIWLLCIAIVAILVINCVPWIMPAYVASLIPIWILLLTFVVRRFTIWISVAYCGKRSKVNAMSRAELLTLAFLIGTQTLSLSVNSYARATYQTGWEEKWAERRQALIRTLEASGKRHLILVQYENVNIVADQEWVYNEADISNAKIIWGRFASEELNSAFVESYPNRNMWKLKIPSGSLEAFFPHGQVR